MKKKSFSPGICAIFVAAAGCLWGTMGLFVRYFSALGLTAMNIVAVRSLVTAVLMVVLALVVDPKLLRVKWRDLWCFIGTGLLSVLFFNFCYFQTIQASSMAVAATLLYTSPVFVMVLSLWLFKERMTGRKILALALTLTGCVLVSGVLFDGGLTLRGALLGVGAGVGYALYSIFGRFALLRGYHSMTVTCYTFLFSSVGGLFFLDLMRIRTAFAAEGWWLTAVFGIYAIVTTVLPYLFYTVGLTGVENSRAAVIAAVEPVMAALLGLLIFREVPSLWTAVGMVLVVTAIVLLNVHGKEN